MSPEYKMSPEYTQEILESTERPLGYTAVTRGNKLVTIIGQPKALAMVFKNKNATKRLTNLAARLRI
jgi:ATP-dependent exoDNAse (exonuclease V) alpha subunit